MTANGPTPSLPAIMVNDELQFHYSKENYVHNARWEDCKTQLSKFDEAVISRWEQAGRDGLFRYLLQDLQTKVLPGPMGYVAQLNTKRATDRRKPQEINSLAQPFNPTKFNFAKVKEGEIIMELCPADKHLTNGEKKKKESQHIIVINVSPLEYCNILLVPRINDHLPQSLTQDAIKVAVEMMLLSAKRSFRIGWNSLCALASVNHLHFHAYYLNYPLKIENEPTKQVKGGCHQLSDWPMVTFVFQLIDDDVDTFASDVYKLCSYFHSLEIAHNLFMTRGCRFEAGVKKSTVRINVFPRLSTFGVKTEDAFNVALCEMAGHLPIKVAECFDTLTEEHATSLMQTAALPAETLDSIRRDIGTLFKKAISET